MLAPRRPERGDLYLVSVRKLSSSPGKLGVMVQSLSWAADCSMLAAMQDTRFSLWYYPAIIYVDRSLLSRTMVERDSGEFGAYPVIPSSPVSSTTEIKLISSKSIVFLKSAGNPIYSFISH